MHLGRIIHSYVHNGRIGVLVELGMQSEITARLEAVSVFINDIAMHIAAEAPDDLSTLQEQNFVKDGSKTIQELLSELSEELGERIAITRFVRWDIEDKEMDKPTPPKDPAVAVSLRAVK